MTNESSHENPIVADENLLHLSDEELHAVIAERAFYKSEANGFLPEFDLGNWLEAEQEINTVIESLR